MLASGALDAIDIIDMKEKLRQLEIENESQNKSLDLTGHDSHASPPPRYGSYEGRYVKQTLTLKQRVEKKVGSIMQMPQTAASSGGRP